MNFVIVYHQSDNFGDNLIGECFGQLLKAALINYGLGSKDYRSCYLPLMSNELDVVREADAVYFAGGGLFGLCYLNFYEPMRKIAEMADAAGVPVFFSSMGINNMDANEENEHLLGELLAIPSIQDISVRENPSIFRYYADMSGRGKKLQIRTVADPVTWAGAVYANSLKKAAGKESEACPADGRKLIGINVIRAGLIRANDRSWGLTNQAEYVTELRRILIDRGFRVCLYTNGSTNDENTMCYIAEKSNISRKELITVMTSRQLISMISACDGIAASRMHSSIISYALNIPATNIVWNDKIPCFYDECGLSGRVFSIDDEEGNPLKPVDVAKKVADRLCELTDGKHSQSVDESYLMSLYDYIYQSVGAILRNSSSGISECTESKYNEVCEKLSSLELPTGFDISDMENKIYGSQKRYAEIYMKSRDKDKTLKRKDKKIEQLREIRKDLRHECVHLKKTCDALEIKNAELEQENEKLRAKVAHFENKRVVKIYRKIRKFV